MKRLNPSILIIINCIFFGLNLVAQKQGNNWYFSHDAGISFNSNPPAALSNSQNKVSSKNWWALGNSSISSSDGKLLFYTNGYTVWDSTHNVMNNGLDLNSNSYWVLYSVIVPKPDNKDLYYIFNVGGIDINSNCEVQFSEINMKLNNGKGRVIRKNVPFRSLVSSIAITQHANQKDFWLLASSMGSDSIFAYLIDKNGISNSPIISKSGVTVSLSFKSFWNILKVSADGSRIFDSFSDTTQYIANFDNLTGVVSNVWKFKLGKKPIQNFKIEFSENSKCYYIFENNHLCQYDLTKITLNDFLASRTIIDSLNDPISSFLDIKLGPDGKIYYNKLLNYTTSEYLHVINAPDSIGYNCRVLQKAVYLNGKNKIDAFPNVLPFFSYKKAFDFTNNCINDTTRFNILDIDDLDSVHWDFGDPESGNLNFSKDINNPNHIYKKTGYYKVSLVSFYKNSMDEYSISILVKNPKPNIGNDTTLCNAIDFSIKPHKNYLKYLWNTGDTLASIFVSNSGEYSVSVTDSTGCIVHDTVNLVFNSVKAGFVLNDSVICQDNLALVRDTSLIVGPKLKDIFWDWGDSGFSNTPFASRRYSDTGSYRLTLHIVNDSGCSDSLTRLIKVNPNSTIGFNINDSIQCLNGNRFDYANTSSFNQGSIINNQWRLGDGSIEDTWDITGKSYTYDTSYLIGLIVQNNFGCSDTLNKWIRVHPNPIALFKIDEPEQCFKNNLFNCLNSSTISSGRIDSFFWNMGDNVLSDYEDILNFSYATADSFKILLIVTSEMGCSDTFSKIAVVHGNPEAMIHLTNDSICSDHEPLSIVNSTNAGNGTLSHYWDFSDGTHDTAAVPFKIYEKSAGAFTIGYRVTNSHGCTDSVSIPLLVLRGPQSGFEIDDTAQCLNANVFNFFNTTIKGDGAQSHKWLLDGLTVSNDDHLEDFRINSAGSHLISLISTSEFNCSDTDTRSVYLENSGTIVIKSVYADSQCLKGNDFLFRIQRNDTDIRLFSTHWQSGSGVSSTDSTFRLSYPDTGVFDVILESVSENSCLDTAVYKVMVIPHPSASFDVDTVCQNLVSTFINTSHSAYGSITEYRWDFGDNTGSTQPSLLKRYASPGTYPVSLSIASEFGCRDTSSVRFALVNPKPMAKFDFNAIESNDAELTLLQMNDKSSSDAILFEWQFSDGQSSNSQNPLVTFKDSNSRKITLIVSNSFSCSDTFNLSTGRLFKPFYFFLPSAFSPNEDANNEEFKPISSRYILKYTMEIYNRWGELVFRTNDINQGWDGKYKGIDCQQDSYFCNVYIIPDKGGPRSYQSSFVLIR